MSMTVISIFALVAFGSTESFLGGVFLLIVLIAAFLSLTSGFGVV